MQDDSIGDIKVIYTVVNLMIISGYEVQPSFTTAYLSYDR